MKQYYFLSSKCVENSRFVQNYRQKLQFQQLLEIFIQFKPFSEQPQPNSQNYIVLTFLIGQQLFIKFNNEMIFIKQISKINQHALQCDKICLDKKFKYIAIYDCNKDCIYITTTLIILHYFIEYKNKFQTDKEYKLSKSLPFLKKLENTKNSSILKFEFMRREGKDLFVVGYYSGLIEIYQHKYNWQKAGNFMTNELITDIYCVDNCIYTINYGFGVHCYSIIMVGKELNSQIQNALHIILKKQQNIYYQTKNSELKNQSKLLIQGHKRKSALLQQIQASENLTQNYQVDFTDHYLIRYQPPQIYSLVSSFTKISSIKFHPDLIVISPFIYKIGKILVLVLGKTLKICKFQQKSQTGIINQSNIIIEIKNIKYQIVKLIWIGPFQIIYLDQKQKMNFIQIFSPQLQI